MPKPKRLVVVTKPAAPNRTESPALADIMTAADELRDHDDSNLLFRPPLFRPIQPPPEIFDTEMKRQKFTVAVHEVGHALASMMVCCPTQCLSVTEINGSVRGGANSTDAHGEDAAIVDLGGIAAEQLVIGSGDCHAGAATDIKYARQNLRDERTPEVLVTQIMKDIHAELLNIFERDWLPGIIHVATKLAQVNVLDWESFVELLSAGQRRAFQAGALTKAATLLCHHEVLQKAIKRHKSSTEFDKLAREIHGGK